MVLGVLVNPSDFRPSANDKYFRVRARVRPPDFEPGADKKFLIENSIPGQGSDNNTQ